MNAKEATKQIRLKQWEEIIQDRCNSGLKVDDYCEQLRTAWNFTAYLLLLAADGSGKRYKE